MNVQQKKAQEISIAVLRSLVHVRRIELRHRLEKLTFELLEESAANNFDEISKITAKMDMLTRFAKLIYEIEPVNGAVILEELGNFQSLVSSLSGFPVVLDEGLFQKERQTTPLFRENAEEKRQRAQGGEKGDKGIAGTDSMEGKGKEATQRRAQKEQAISGFIAEERKDDEFANQAMRQTAIIEQIKKSGNSPLPVRDLIAAFPGVNQRTLRYDLQKLCREGIIARIGSGGPKTFYQIRAV